MNIYQSNANRKNLDWLHFDDEPGFQEGHLIKDQQWCISVPVIYVTYLTARSTSPHMTVFEARPYGRFTEIQSNLRRKKLHKTNQGSSFLGCCFSNRNNVRAPIQFRRERESQHLKRWFFFKSFHFHIISTKIIRLAKWNQLSISELKSTSHFLPQSTVSRRSDSSSGTNCSCCYRSDAWSHLRVESSIISIDSNITDNIIRKVSNV